jgi:ribonuclease HIII
MSKLSKLCGKLQQEIVLGEGDEAIKIVLKVPKIKELSNLVELFKEDSKELSGEKLQKIVEVLEKQIKEAVPDATDEEIQEVILSNLPKLIEGLTTLLSKAFDNGKK